MFLFQAEIKKKYWWKCWFSPSNRPNQQIKPHPSRWHYPPLITYLNCKNKTAGMTNLSTWPRKSSCTPKKYYILLCAITSTRPQKLESKQGQKKRLWKLKLNPLQRFQREWQVFTKWDSKSLYLVLNIWSILCINWNQKLKLKTKTQNNIFGKHWYFSQIVSKKAKIIT